MCFLDVADSTDAQQRHTQSESTQSRQPEDPCWSLSIAPVTLWDSVLVDSDCV